MRGKVSKKNVIPSLENSNMNTSWNKDFVKTTVPKFVRKTILGTERKDRHTQKRRVGGRLKNDKSVNV